MARHKKVRGYYTTNVSGLFVESTDLGRSFEIVGNKVEIRLDVYKHNIEDKKLLLLLKKIKDFPDTIEMTDRLKVLGFKERSKDNA